MENDPASPLVGSAIKRKLNSLLLVHESAPVGGAPPKLPTSRDCATLGASKVS